MTFHPTKAYQQARVLLVGTGRMGRIRANAIYSNPRFEFVGVVDENVDAARELADVYRTAHYPSLAQAIEQSHHPSSASSLHGIIISTPTPSHAPLIATAASNNISVFTEKPIDETSDQIRSIFNNVRSINNNNKNVALCCGFQRRFDPSYQTLHSHIQTGHIGTPLSATITFGDHPVPPRQFLLQGGGNIISDCSAHDVDYIRWVLGDEVESVYAVGKSSDEELERAGVVDSATVLMKFRKGTIVTLSLTRGSTYGYDQRIEILGTHGLASVTNTPETCTTLSNDTGIHSPKYQHSFPQRFEKAFENELDAFADTVLDGKEWIVGEEDCVEVQRVCDAAVESCESGRVVVIDY